MQAVLTSVKSVTNERAMPAVVIYMIKQSLLIAHKGKKKSKGIPVTDRGGP
jgi:hypothetical protein